MSARQVRYRAQASAYARLAFGGHGVVIDLTGDDVVDLTGDDDDRIDPTGDEDDVDLREEPGPSASARGKRALARGGAFATVADRPARPR